MYACIDAHEYVVCVCVCCKCNGMYIYYTNVWMRTNGTAFAGVF